MGSLSLIKKVQPYFKRYRGILYLDLFCAGLTTLSEIVLPLILRYITNTGMTNLDALTWEKILRLGLVFVVVKTIEVVAGFYMTSIGHIMGAKIETDMRRDVYAHLQGLSYRFYNETKVGVLMSRLTNDLFDITEFAHHCPEEYFIGGLKILVSFIILMGINPLLTLVIYLLIPLMILTASKYNRKMRRAQKEQRVHVGDLNSTIEDSLSGVRVVKSFANEEKELEKFQRENQKFLGIKKTFYRSMAGFNTITKIFDGLMYLVVILLGGYLLIQGDLEAGDLIAYVMYVNTLLLTVRRIVEFTEQFQKGMTGIERFAEIMAEDGEIQDPVHPKAFKNIQGEIIFDKVDFSYNEEEKILDNFNLRVSPGENLAIVGPSGSGKTTICSLIPRFYDVDKGSISIDNINIKDIRLADLRREIGLVQQDVYLFSGTVYENILYGDLEASPEDVIQAAKLAGAHDFIKDLPQGYDTYVGERGVMLSGGQKQRLSIARVFLKDPSILILDEATSALDNKSEQVIQESLKVLSENRTTITIAHRLTTIQEADRILVMTDQGIIEEGNHQELMDLRGEYYRLYTKNGLTGEDLDWLENPSF